MSTDDELLADLQDNCAFVLVDLGIAPEKALIAAQTLRTFLSCHWGGQQIYFSSQTSLTERNNAIYEQHNGHNRDALIRRYGISQRQFYNILKQVRAERAANRKSALTPPNNDPANHK